MPSGVPSGDSNGNTKTRDLTDRQEHTQACRQHLENTSNQPEWDFICLAPRCYDSSTPHALTIRCRSERLRGATGGRQVAAIYVYPLRFLYQNQQGDT